MTTYARWQLLCRGKLRVVHRAGRRW